MQAKKPQPRMVEVPKPLLRLPMVASAMSSSLSERPERTSTSPVRMNSGMAISAKRSEEHTSELQSLMRTTYDVFCLKKKIIKTVSTKARNRHDNISYNKEKQPNQQQTIEYVHTTETINSRDNTHVEQDCEIYDVSTMINTNTRRHP